MRFVGHRGASHAFPELTMAAITKALALGMSFECDLQVLRSGEVVLLHDDTLERTAAPWSADCGREEEAYKTLVTTTATSLSLAEVGSVDVGSWFGAAHREERVPLFSQALHALKESPDASSLCCFAELKASDGVEGGRGPLLPEADRLLVAAADSVARAEQLLPDQLVWISFSLAVAEEMKRRMPMHASLLIKHAHSTEEAWQAARDSVEHGLDGIDLYADPNVVTAELVEWLRTQNKMVAVWVPRSPAVNDTPEVWTAMRDAGVAYFTSNLPDELDEWRRGTVAPAPA